MNCWPKQRGNRVCEVPLLWVVYYLDSWVYVIEVLRGAIRFWNRWVNGGPYTMGCNWQLANMIFLKYFDFWGLGLKEESLLLLVHEDDWWSVRAFEYIVFHWIGVYIKYQGIIVKKAEHCYLRRISGFLQVWSWAIRRKLPQMVDLRCGTSLEWCAGLMMTETWLCFSLVN